MTFLTDLATTWQIDQRVHSRERDPSFSTGYLPVIEWYRVHCSDGCCAGNESGDKCIEYVVGRLASAPIIIPE